MKTFNWSPTKTVLIFILCITTYSCKKEDLPSIVTSLESSFGVVSGRIVSDGGSPITSCGLIISLINPSPDLNDFVLNCTDMEDNFTFDLGINDPYTYYIRAFASNHKGYAFGNVVILHDENRYPSVTIGTQEWMAINLATTKFRNGDPIPLVTDDDSWFNLNTAAACYYRNDTVNYFLYGMMFNWYAVNDPRNIAPPGWHLPSDQEWEILIEYLGGENVAGDKLKEAGSEHWFETEYTSSSATNETGFTALPGGLRTMNDRNEYYFAYLGQSGCWWSASEVDLANARLFAVHYHDAKAKLYVNDKRIGVSVRCIKD